MHLVPGAERRMLAFISHSAGDDDEARYLEALLAKAGLSVFREGDGLAPGRSLIDDLFKKLERCHFFFVIVSDESLASQWVQGELGLAVHLRSQNRGYRPTIIPIYAKKADWRRTGKRPGTFPTRDFNSGETGEAFDLQSIRGLDRHANPSVDSVSALAELVKPYLLVTRLDFDDEETFERTKVFRLYEDAFPPVERDDNADIVEWVLRTDIGQQRNVCLRDGTLFSYTLDSRYFILCVAGTAIGLAFYTYDYTSELAYLNYIAIQECWRNGGVGTAFLEESMKIQNRLFPQNQGMVLELETFELGRIERIISHLETHDKKFDSNDDELEIKKFLRIAWYQGRGWLFFINEETKEPLAATAPCIDPSEPRENWQALEESYWIMWHGKPDAPLNPADAKTIWANAITCIYTEVLIKSLADGYPDEALDYWRYANAVVDRSLSLVEEKQISLGRFLDPAHNALFKRWVKLGMYTHM